MTPCPWIVWWLSIGLSVAHLEPGPVFRDVQATTHVTNRRPRIAEPFDVRVRVTAPADSRVQFPKMESRWGPFEVVTCDDQFDVPDSVRPDQRTWTRRLTLESLQTGELQIPPLEIMVETASATRQIQSPSETVQVISVLENRADPLKFRDIREARDIELSDSSSYGWVAWIAVAAGALALFGLVALYLSRRPRTITPNAWAMASLQALYEQDLAESGCSAKVMGVIEKTLRGYLPSKFNGAGWPGSHDSAERWFEALHEHGLPSAWIASLQKLLQGAERVRFGGVELTPDELSAAVDEALCLIQNLDAAMAPPASPDRNTMGGA